MASKFIPPTIEECEAYKAQENHYLVNVAVFWNYYDSVDWHVGKKKMSNWRSAMAGWQAREEAKVGIKASEKCLVCKRPGVEGQVNKKNKKVWLCKDCKWRLQVMGYKVWGWLAKSKIERLVEQGKQKLNPEPLLYDVPQLKSVPKEPNKRAIINRYKDDLGI
jgi:ribosomal protein L37AE/L43A